MLVLSRKKGESIVIGDDIVVEVLEIKGDVIKIGITAPGNVRILRFELLPDQDPPSQTTADAA